MAAVIDFESINSMTSTPVVVPEDPITISAAAIASAVPSAIVTYLSRADAEIHFVHSHTQPAGKLLESSLPIRWIFNIAFEGFITQFCSGHAKCHFSTVASGCSA